jgi:multidrug efflux pump subunit AcrA (membrane-fusion protein)
MDINNIVNSTRIRNARLLDDINNKILNREYYKFKYLPLEGALPGLYFQQQTEDAINDIGNVAYATEQVADEALKIAQQAYNIALAALETANNALAAAQTAQQTADTALNTAKNALSVGTAAATAAAAAQKAADAAQKAADAAQKTADAAQKTADAAQKAADAAANKATNALTKAEDALTKIEQLSVLNYYNNLTKATDVNTLVDIHRWYLQASNNPNAPETNPGFLNVDNDYNDSVCKQLWVSKTTGAIYNRFGQIVENSDPATVSSWSEWYKLATKADIDGTTTALTKRIDTVANNLATHEADFDNPHKVTAEQLGLTTVYQYKGSVATYADLPTTGQKVGDVWNVETADPDHGIKAGDNVAWDGAQWDTLGGNHDLSGYAQLNSANTFTALNTFRANIRVSNGTAAGSSGTISFGISPTNETVQARISTDNLGGLFYHASTKQPHIFRVGMNIDAFVIRADDTKIAFSSNNNFFAAVTYDGVAKWLGNANTATKLETSRTINGVAFDGTKDITIEAGGGGDVTAAGDNNFTGTNTFNKPITVRDGALAGIGGTIILGTKPNSATTQAKINSTTTGAMYYTATEGLGHFFNVGTAAVATIGGTATTATLDFLANSILKYSTSSGLRVGGGGTSKIIGFYPEAADNTAGMRLSNQAEAISTDYSIFSLQNNPAISYTKNAALQVGNFKILEVDRNNNNVTIKADSNGQILFTPNNLASNTSSIDSNGNFYISQGLTVGSTLNTGTSNGVIRAGNNESCLYFTGTAENTYYATPNTGNTISYQSAANCYLINCSINNPSSLKMNFSNMNFKATVGSVPYMCKTLTFWLPVGATVPAVTWTFPTGSAVYYPKGVAPTLTANANNIINVIAVVDNKGSFSIQVCDTVVLPYSG